MFPLTYRIVLDLSTLADSYLVDVRWIDGQVSQSISWRNSIRFHLGHMRNIMNASEGNNSSTWGALLENSFQNYLWVDYVGFVAHGLISVLGGLLNGFVVWVLAQDPQRSFIDGMYMNQAVGDLLDGSLGLILLSWARIIIMYDWRKGLWGFFASTTLFMINVTVEDITTIIVTFVKTRQVLLMKQASIKLSGNCIKRPSKAQEFLAVKSKLY